MLQSTPKEGIRRFSFSDAFIDSYRNQEVPWGPLGYPTYKDRYSRRLEDFGLKGEGTEEWVDTCRRVVEGVFTIQKRHVVSMGTHWDNAKAQRTAKDMFDRLFNLKWTPPGRGLWMMGTPYVEERTGAGLFNCAFRSTRDLAEKGGYLFGWIMDALMVGVGVGFDTRGANTVTIKSTRFSDSTHVIGDDREGWVESVVMLIDAFLTGKPLPQFDYSAIRPAGAPIRGFGGTASGPGPLMELHWEIAILLGNRVGQLITSTDIVRIGNLIGKCVVAGNVRRSAELAMGQADDSEFLSMKLPEVAGTMNTYCQWASNNSPEVHVGMDYTELAAYSAVNGEPGYIWLDNARKFGRMKDGLRDDDYNVMGFNPCVEQQLEDAELCCTTGDTRILTRSSGNPRIKDLVGKSVEVWNGQEWSRVEPFLAAKDKQIYRVHISDGSYLDCTDNHEWAVKTQTERTYKKLRTDELTKGMILPSFSVDNQSCYKQVADSNAYRYGWFTGDGFMDGNRALALVQQPEYSILRELNGIEYLEQLPEGYAYPFKRVNLSQYIDKELGETLRDKEQGLPDFMFKWDHKSILDFVGGWIDTDGCLRQNPNTDHYIINSTSEKKLRDLQLLLRRVGINHASLQQWQPAQHETNYGRRNHPLWCLLIPTYECHLVRTRLKIAKRFGSKFKKNPRHPDTLISRAKRQKIVKIEKLESCQDVYCFTEPKRHMGVFGNVLTYQCLVETYPAHHDDFEDYLKTLKVAYLYGKTVTLVNTHWAETNAVMLKNRRIGTSMSGIWQAFKKHGRRQFFNWCDQAYGYLQELDRVYSDWLCVPMSKRMTSIKPSGTVSKLAGATPGAHPAQDEYWICRIRFDNDSPMFKALVENGYPHEPIAYGSDEQRARTSVVEFPVQESYFERGVRDVSMWEQLEVAAQLQHYWADNSVSVTVSFKPEEAKDIKHALELYETRLKAVSFLPYFDPSNSIYPQMPNEPITAEEYERRLSSITPLTSVFTNEGGKGERFCTNDTCTI